MGRNTDHTENTKVAILRMMRKTRQTRIRIIIGCILALAFAIYMVIGFGEERVNKLGSAESVDPNNTRQNNTQPNSMQPSNAQPNNTLPKSPKP